MKIYVASSWRNELQPLVVTQLASEGYDVYDFRSDGFSWAEVDTEWEDWGPQGFLSGLCSKQAECGFKNDFLALQHCDALIAVSPFGVSTGIELGWAAGRRKLTAVYIPVIREPELMIKVADVITPDFDIILSWLRAN